MDSKTGIIFDMDGTLWDSSANVAASWTEVIQRHPECGRSGITRDEIMSVMGKPMDEIAGIFFADTDPDQRESLLNDCGEYENEYLKQHGGVLYDGLEDTLQQLTAAGYLLYIVSNCQSGYIEAFLTHYGFGKYFKDHLCWGDNRKTKDINIRLMAEKHGLSRYFYVGDIQADCDSTEAAGGEFIHADYGFGTIDHEVPAISDIRDLPQLMKSL